MEESWIQHLIPDGPHCSHFGLSGNLNHTRQTKLSSFQQAASVAASNLEEAMASSSLSLFSYFTSFFLWHPQWHFSYYWQATSAAAAGSLRARCRASGLRRGGIRGLGKAVVLKQQDTEIVPCVDIGVVVADGGVEEPLRPDAPSGTHSNHPDTEVDERGSVAAAHKQACSGGAPPRNRSCAAPLSADVARLAHPGLGLAWS